MTPGISIVATMYNSERYVLEFYTRCRSVVDELGVGYEFVLVDDGSPDQSKQVARKIADEDPNVKVVELSRNHGHHRAMLIGLSEASLAYCFLIDIDLEEPPECLLKFWRVMQENGDTDMVYGVQKEKRSTPIRSFFSKSFYKVFNALSWVSISDSELVARLMTRDVVAALLAYGERSLFIPGIWWDVGFNRVAVEVEKSFDGSSSYGFSRRISMAVDAITSFSAKPLVFVFYLGFGISFLSFLAILYLVVSKLLWGVSMAGWTSTIASIYLVGGLILFSIGIVGIYLSKVFIEVKGRPTSLIRNIYTGRRNDSEG